MIFDIVLLIFVGLGFYQGYKNGIIYSVFSLLGWFIGIIAALKFSYVMANLLRSTLQVEPRTLSIIAFVVMLLLVLLLARSVAWALEQILKTFSLNLPNRIAGGLLHAAIALFVLAVFTWFLNRMDTFPKDMKRDSHTYGYVAPLGPAVIKIMGKIIPLARNTFEEFDTLFGTELTPEKPM